MKNKHLTNESLQVASTFVCTCTFYLFCALVFTFLLAPLVVVIPMSFTASRYLDFPPPGLSLKWYRNFINSNEWMNALGLSLKVALLTTIIATVFGTISAYVICRSTFPGKRIVATLLVSPLIVAIIVLAVGIYFVFAKMGLLETALGLVLAHTVIAIPFVFVVVSSVVEKVDEGLEKAAMALGASRLFAFRRITLPLIKPGIIAGAIFSFITSFDEIVIAIFISGTHAVTLPKKMWDGIRFEIDPTIAVVSTVLVSIATLGIVVIWLLFRGQHIAWPFSGKASSEDYF